MTHASPSERPPSRPKLDGSHRIFLLVTTGPSSHARLPLSGTSSEPLSTERSPTKIATRARQKLAAPSDHPVEERGSATVIDITTTDSPRYASERACGMQRARSAAALAPLKRVRRDSLPAQRGKGENQENHPFHSICSGLQQGPIETVAKARGRWVQDLNRAGAVRDVEERRPT